jgi:hypothetical protein
LMYKAGKYIPRPEKLKSRHTADLRSMVTSTSFVVVLTRQTCRALIKYLPYLPSKRKPEAKPVTIAQIVPRFNIIHIHVESSFADLPSAAVPAYFVMRLNTMAYSVLAPIQCQRHPSSLPPTHFTTPPKMQPQFHRRACALRGCM